MMWVFPTPPLQGMDAAFHLRDHPSGNYSFVDHLMGLIHLQGAQLLPLIVLDPLHIREQDELFGP